MAKDNPAVKYLQVQPLSIPVMNGNIIEKIKKRLAECQEKHTCCPSKVSPTLPKRVVDVGTDSLNPRLTLHISEPNEKALYVALSYCWGGPQEITTTLATLKTYTSSLPAELPRTFQDAIQVTRSLGFRYLWIDALCIVQDDDSDKTAEISDMGLVYKNATLTIAAASAHGVKDGFLQDRPQLPMCQLPFYITDDSCGAIWMRYPVMVTATEPLDSRAWALQESLLAPRILYYATQDLIWKCREDKFVPVNETHNPCGAGPPGGLPNKVFSNSQKSTSAVLHAKTWGDIIADYSGRKLSVPEDRLPALAGLARELQIMWNDSYVAGMWRSCLVKHLGRWQTFPIRDVPKAAYKSPGWSWVSRESKVSVKVVQHEEAEVINVAVTLADRSLPFGQVCNGILVLQAPVLPGGVEMRSHHYCGMNFLPDELCNDDDSTFLLLGYSSYGTSIGLILQPAEAGTFMRVGQFSGLDQKGVDPWSTHLVKREVITIV
jgi:hypothetical protein